MSGDLKNPSKSIPKGTLSGLLLTFFTYATVILSMAASTTRQSFYNNVNVIQVVSLTQNRHMETSTKSHRLTFPALWSYLESSHHVSFLL